MKLCKHLLTIRPFRDEDVTLYNETFLPLCKHLLTIHPLGMKIKTSKQYSDIDFLLALQEKKTF